MISDKYENLKNPYIISKKNMEVYNKKFKELIKNEISQK